MVPIDEMAAAIQQVCLRLADVAHPTLSPTRE